VGRAEDALAAIASVIRTTLHVATAEVYLKDSREDLPRLVVRSPRSRGESEAAAVPDLVTWVAREGQAAAELQDGTTRLQDANIAPERQFEDLENADVKVLNLPLRVRNRTVGVLRLSGPGGILIQVGQRRFVEVLSYYAALGVERVRLVAEAEHAAALAEADRMKDALLATVSHDLRTPLTSIRAIAHEIAESGDERGTTIEGEAARLNELVADLLDLSQLQAGAVHPEVQVNEAGDLIGSALQQLSRPLQGRRVTVTIEPPDAILFGRFDFVHALRVMVNLIENAIKYSPADQPIDVGAHRDGDVLVFSVADRGPGIPASERHLIYQPFYRSGTTKTRIVGTGLGLTIATRLAELQGGILRHMPRAGGGTVFVFRVPAADSLPQS
jgi:two-component system sensor histidine kinase KdpD